MSTFTLPLGARASKRPLSDFPLHAMGVRVVSLRRSNGMPSALSEDTVLEDGDTLVLSGKAEALALAEIHLLKG